jgi:hypothetical protein
MSSHMLVRDTTNNKTKILEVNGSTISASDSTAQGKLDTINSTLAAGIDVTDSAVATALGGTLTVSDSTAQGSLSSINTALGGTLSVADSAVASALGGSLTVSDSTAQGKLDTINTTLSGTLTTTQGVSRTNGNIAVSSSVTTGDVSASVDGNNFKRAIVFGNLGASSDVIIQVSNDNSTFYENQELRFYSNAMSNDFAGSFNVDARYFRLKYGATSTVTVRYALVA